MAKNIAKIIAFDLDGTLAHTIRNANNYNLAKYRKFDFTFRINNTHYFTWVRPGTQTLLSVLAKDYKLYLFTKSSKIYADQIVHRMFNKEPIFTNRFYKDSFPSNEPKNVTLITTEKVILVDDNITNKTGEDNEIFYHIPPYNLFLENDNELHKLMQHFNLFK